MAGHLSGVNLILPDVVVTYPEGLVGVEVVEVVGIEDLDGIVEAKVSVSVALAVGVADGSARVGKDTGARWAAKDQVAIMSTSTSGRLMLSTCIGSDNPG